MGAMQLQRLVGNLAISVGCQGMNHANAFSQGKTCSAIKSGQARRQMRRLCGRQEARRTGRAGRGRGREWGPANVESVTTFGGRQMASSSSHIAGRPTLSAHSASAIDFCALSPSLSLPALLCLCVCVCVWAACILAKVQSHRLCLQTYLHLFVSPCICN